MAPFIVLEGLRKKFSDHPVLQDISLQVEEGEILTLLGPSGSGKTTLLRLLAGFETPDGGAIRVGEEEVTGISPERRNFGMVFQHYALFPHLSVAENIAFGLEARNQSRQEIKERLAEVLALVDLAGFEDRRVQEISGGQQQRVALARALAPRPRLLLLDEPLSNLDPDLRERTRRQLRRAVKQVGLTAIWVTHEQEEAFDVGDRIALLDAGVLVQVGSPEELYLEPASLFVAGFVGRASILEGEQLQDGRVKIGDDRFRGHGVRWSVAGVGDRSAGDKVDVVFRPETLGFESPDHPESLVGKILQRQYTGEATFFLVELEGGGEVLVRGDRRTVGIDSRVGVVVRPDGPPPRSFVRTSEAIS
jgi:ABC-type Fe3+/spermidine/putrescine transport system ATPase subunit